MPPAHIGVLVCLKEDVASLGLRRGDRGVVVSVWLSPGDFLCEVEFAQAGRREVVRTLLRAGQFDVVE